MPLPNAFHTKHPLRFRPDGGYRILMMSDAHLKPDKEERTLRAMETLIDGTGPDLVLLNGDNVAAFTDQARLHDTHFALRDSVRFMRERAELFDAMMPGISIDTDAGSGGTRRDFMRYARECSSFGVPDLYVLNPIEDSAVTPEDWEEIPAVL